MKPLVNDPPVCSTGTDRVGNSVVSAGDLGMFRLRRVAGELTKTSESVVVVVVSSIFLLFSFFFFGFLLVISSP
jgi:hypothetical protein